MIVLLLIISVVTTTLTTITELQCQDTSADIPACSGNCRVRCASSCRLFNQKGAVSLCGWLQSLGYDTSELLIKQEGESLVVAAQTTAHDADNSIDRRASEEPGLLPHQFPYVQFEFKTQPLSQKVDVYSTVELSCEAEANSSVLYQWYHTETSFDETPNLPVILPGATGQNYTIYSVTSSESGYYICGATELFSGDVYWSQPAKLEVLYMSTVTETTEDLEIESGIKIKRVSCLLPNSYPEALARWYKISGSSKLQIIDFDDMFFNNEEGYLFFVNPNSTRHDGVYECVASNNNFQTETTVKTLTVTVTGNEIVSYQPPMKAFFDAEAATNVAVGEELVLRCAVYGNPLPTVHWSFGDSLDTLCRIPNSRYTSYDKGRHVVLKEVRVQDLDYKYECKGSTESTGTADAVSRDIGTLTNVGSFEELKIEQDDLQYEPALGTNVTLSCPVLGEINNDWYHNGQLLSNNGVYYTKNVTYNSLEVMSDTTSHGVYTCLSTSRYGGLVLRNLHTTVPVLPITMYMYLDLSNNVQEDRYVTCSAAGFPPPRLYWYEDEKQVVDSTRFTFSFDRSNSTVINTTLDISNLTKATVLKCQAVSQTEGYMNRQAATYTVGAQGEEVVQYKNMYYIVAASVGVVLVLLAAVFTLCLKFRHERENTKPIRSYMKSIQDMEKMGGEKVSSKTKLRDEYKYAAHLHDILKTMQIEDQGDIESFRDIIGDWVNEDVGGGEDSDFARRFRESFISKRSMGNRLNSSNRYGNQFKLNFTQGSESNLLDETPERVKTVPIGSSRRASNPLYAPIPRTQQNPPQSIGETMPLSALRNSNI